MPAAPPRPRRARPYRQAARRPCGRPASVSLPTSGQRASTAFSSTGAAASPAVAIACMPRAGRDRAQRGEGGASSSSEHALPDLSFDVAAEDRAPAGRQLALDRAGQRADRRQRADAQEQADEQQPQPAKRADRSRRAMRQAARPRKRPDRPVTCRLVSLGDSPSASVTIRSQRSASAGSWVMMTSVAPVSRAAGEQQLDDRRRRSRRRDCRSARRRRSAAGRGAMARAMATRCCSPPESCAG